MPHDPHLAERMRTALSARTGIEERKMFGGFCWMLNGNMLCGVEAGRYMFRVGKSLESDALSRPEKSQDDRSSAAARRPTAESQSEKVTRSPRGYLRESDSDRRAVRRVGEHTTFFSL